MKIHLAVYNPKYAGILSAALDMDADQVILLHRNKDDTSGIKAVLQSRGIKCLTQEFSFDACQTRHDIQALILLNQDNKFILNASGGFRKTMLLCFEQFTKHKLPVFMVDKFTDTLFWLNCENPDRDIHLSHKIKIHEYLKTFNTQILEHGQTTPEPLIRRELTQWLIQNIQTYDDEIASLNYLAMNARNNHRTILSNTDMKKTTLLELIEKFESAGMLKLKGNKINFIDDESRFYANGGWLENHVFSLIYGMRKSRPHINDVAKAVTIVRSQGKVKNEIDVVAMSHNRLHIIECKTRKFSKSAKESTPASSAIYRLDTIKSLSGGLSGKAMLVSFQPLSKYTYSRAKDLGIYCCAHTQLKQLEHHLFNFFDS